MQPVLAEGDGVITARVPGNSPLRVSDIVVAKHPFQTGIVLVKRISAVEDNRFHLLGDRPAESTDSRSLGAFSPDLILGRVVARVPGRST
ncbi:MAG: nickel-type superoxide dismutase maturation protease [Myxococcales bacterium]|nr:nickel-type superoxide dismutase maturation protease [Myxococcales bacterium]